MNFHGISYFGLLSRSYKERIDVVYISPGEADVLSSFCQLDTKQGIPEKRKPQSKNFPQLLEEFPPLDWLVNMPRGYFLDCQLI